MSESEVLNSQPVVDPISPSEAELESFESEEKSPASPEASSPVSKEQQALQKQVEKLEKVFKLKVNGKEIEEKIDLNDEARIIKALQMEKLSTEATQRAAAKEKELANMNAQLDQFFELLKSNPLQVLMNPDLGLNAEELANKILDMKIEEEMKTPEQKALEEAKAKLEEYERKEKEARDEAERLKIEKIQSDFEKEVSSSINNAITSGKLPASPYIVAKFAQLMDVALEKNLDVNPNDLIPIISSAYKKDMKEMAKLMSDEELEEVATPERIKEIRNKKIQAVRAANAKAANSVKVEETSHPKKDEGSKKKENFFKKLGDW